MNHKWINKTKHYGGESAECERCGIKRDKRHAHAHHWTEYRRPNGEWFTSDKTPVCELVQCTECYGGWIPGGITIDGIGIDDEICGCPAGDRVLKTYRDKEANHAL